MHACEMMAKVNMAQMDDDDAIKAT